MQENFLERLIRCTMYLVRCNRDQAVALLFYILGGTLATVIILGFGKALGAI